MRLEADFGEIVDEVLRAHPEGLGEHALIRALRATGRVDFVRADLREPLRLFRTHFLLFHALYALRERWWAERRGHLEIAPLRIVLAPWRSGSRGLARHDPLRDYYLNATHLQETTAEDVHALLQGFWKRLGGDRGRRKALAALGLHDPVDAATIKKTYRRLAMRVHPDRGGDGDRLQRLNAAMAVLAEGPARR